jgi:hypothetical protein
MTNGIKHAPWWALWSSGLVAQGGLLAAQVLAYRSDGGVLGVLGLATLQAVAGIAMAYGPRSAGRLASDVGSAYAKANDKKAEETGPKA